MFHVDLKLLRSFAAVACAQSQPVAPSMVAPQRPARAPSASASAAGGSSATVPTSG